jgi:hypothetical protein
MAAAIERVLIVDDQEDARTSMRDIVQDANLEPFIQREAIKSKEHFIEQTCQNYDAAIFDQHLSSGNFAAFEGAAAVADLYRRQFPALLATKLSGGELDSIRKFRSKIPVLLMNGDPQPDDIIDGIHICRREFAREFTDARKPWRTLLRITESDSNGAMVSVIVPAWSDTEIRISVDVFPEGLRSLIRPDARFFAEVNLGAQASSDLYFENFKPLNPVSEAYARFIRP